jgi:hypothetical protein
MEKYKETNNDIQNTTNKYGTIGTPTKTEVNSYVPEWLGVSALLVTVKRHKHHLVWISCWTPMNVNKYI